LKNFPSFCPYSPLWPYSPHFTVHSLDNLRPISLLSVFSKVFERIVFDQLSEFFERNHLLSCFQFGFRRGKSTADAVFEFVDCVMGGWVTVHYRCFLWPIQGIRLGQHWDYLWESEVLRSGWNRTWLAELLFDQQMVAVDLGAESGHQKIFSGVPKGSIFGPLLFLDTATISLI